MSWSTGFCLLQVILCVAGTNPLASIFEGAASALHDLLRRPPQTDPIPLVALGCGTFPRSCPLSKYRTYEGTCNNLRHPALGSTNTPYTRLLPPNYGDGISLPTLAKSGNPLPSARAVSLVVYPDVYIEDPQYTLNAMQYGQFVTHDMSLTTGTVQAQNVPTRCCSPEGQLLELANDPQQCFPILIPDNDPINVPNNVRCLAFTRTITDRDRSCVGGVQPAEQLTEVNHYLDLSLVYGNTEEIVRQLRLFQNGLLKVEARKGQYWPPRSLNASGACAIQSAQEACYFAGDLRANQNAQLTVLQVIYVREHNRIATVLGHLNPHWNDEIIFQEARRINIAQHQQITYYEWLPTYLGEENLIQDGVLWPTSAYVNDYDETVNPTVLNEHANAAFRFFHSLIMGYLHLIAENRVTRGTLRLSDWLNRPQILEENDNFDDLARGLNTQHMHASDQYHDSEITNYFFRGQRNFGTDLKALDIQRNRDHGLASYNDYREFCGLPRATCFEDFLDVISADNVQRLASLYEVPDDVELTVGGSLEHHLPESIVGPTFYHILKEQFYRTRVGDRYWFENDAPVTGFTLPQLYEIRKASISRLICDNGRNIRSMQPRGFEKISVSNAVIPCQDLPELDLSLWKETPNVFHHPHDIFFRK